MAGLLISCHIHARHSGLGLEVYSLQILVKICAGIRGAGPGIERVGVEFGGPQQTSGVYKARVEGGSSY